jgi:hypothetical protein
MEAFDNFDEDVLNNVLKSNTIKFLDIDIARAAQSLKIPGGVSSKNHINNDDDSLC